MRLNSREALGTGLSVRLTPEAMGEITDAIAQLKAKGVTVQEIAKATGASLLFIHDFSRTGRRLLFAPADFRDRLIAFFKEVMAQTVLYAHARDIRLEAEVLRHAVVQVLDRLGGFCYGDLESYCALLPGTCRESTRMKRKYFYVPKEAWEKLLFLQKCTDDDLPTVAHPMMARHVRSQRSVTFDWFCDQLQQIRDRFPDWNNLDIEQYVGFPHGTVGLIEHHFRPVSQVHLTPEQETRLQQLGEGHPDELWVRRNRTMIRAQRIIDIEDALAETVPWFARQDIERYCLLAPGTIDMIHARRTCLIDVNHVQLERIDDLRSDIAHVADPFEWGITAHAAHYYADLEESS